MAKNLELDASTYIHTWQLHHTTTFFMQWKQCPTLPHPPPICRRTPCRRHALFSGEHTARKNHGIHTICCRLSRTGTSTAFGRCCWWYRRRMRLSWPRLVWWPSTPSALPSWRRPSTAAWLSLRRWYTTSIGSTLKLWERAGTPCIHGGLAKNRLYPSVAVSHPFGTRLIPNLRAVLLSRQGIFRFFSIVGIGVEKSPWMCRPMTKLQSIRKIDERCRWCTPFEHSLGHGLAIN